MTTWRARIFRAISVLSLERRSAWVRWLFAALAFAIAVGLRWVLDPHLPGGFPFVTFFPAVMLTTFFGGIWPGIVVGAASFVTSWLVFIPPRWTFDFSPDALLAMGFFFSIVVTIIALIHAMARAIRHLDEERRRSAVLAEQQRLMFHELQHRVSNNLATVAGLLTIQRRGLQNGEARRALEDAAARINVIARMARLLHDPSAQDVDFGRFLSDMTRDLTEAAGVAGRITASVDAAPLRIFRDKAIPLGLIATELISNSIEHGFPDGARGNLLVTLTCEDGEARLRIEDDGRGLPDGFTVEQATSLGLSIARQFSEQVGGSLTMRNRAERGAVSECVFPLV